MATLHWAARPTPQHDVTVFASRLPVSSWVAFVKLVRASFAVRSQLRRSPGLVGYSLVAEVRTRTLWTISAWQRPADLTAFVAADPHVSVMRRTRALVGTPTFRQWIAAAGDVPYARTSIAAALPAVPADSGSSTPATARPGPEN